MTAVVLIFEIIDDSSRVEFFRRTFLAAVLLLSYLPLRLAQTLLLWKYLTALLFEKLLFLSMFVLKLSQKMWEMLWTVSK